MLNKKYIPTPLIEKKKKKKVKIVEKIDKRRVTTPYVIRRFIIYFLAVQWRRFTGKANMEKTATQLREIFEDFGGFDEIECLSFQCHQNSSKFTMLHGNS